MCVCVCVCVWFLGMVLTDDELNKTFVRFKELADKKKEITTADLEALFSSDQVCIYINTHMFYMYTHEYIFAHTYYTHMGIYICMLTGEKRLIYIHIYIYIYVYIYMRYIYIYMRYIYIYIYIYI